MRMPVCFIGHGSPMNAIENNIFTKEWKNLIENIHPKAILMISAHWVSDKFEITTNLYPKMIYDMFGFPDQLYTVDYPAHTDKTIIERCLSILPTLKENNIRGYDHGAWSILIHMFPKADIPVIQLSLNRNASPQEHYELGKSLQILRDEGVLIVGSGNIVHNLRVLDWENENNEYDWAKNFRQRVNECLINYEDEQLIEYKQWGNDAILSVNSSEHYLPLIVCLGASNHDSVLITNDKIISGSLSMTCVVWNK